MDESLTYNIEKKDEKPELETTSGIVLDVEKPAVAQQTGEIKIEGGGETMQKGEETMQGVDNNIKNVAIMTENSTNSTIKELSDAEIERKERKERFIEFFEKLFCLVNRTCEKVGIDKKTYYNWRKEDHEFDQALKKLEANEDEFVLNKLKESVVNNDKPTIRFWASKKLAGFNTTKIETEITPSKSLKEVAEELEAILKKKLDANKGAGNNNQQGPNGKLPDDPKQKGNNSAVQKQPGTGNILEKKDAPKHLAQAKTGGVK